MALREKKKTNCKTFCLKRLETGTICIKKGIYYRTSPVHGNFLNFTFYITPLLSLLLISKVEKNTAEMAFF